MRRLQTRLKRILVAVSIAILPISAARADTISLRVLEVYYQALEQVHRTCGRYPTTAEGLEAVSERPSALVCPNGSQEIWQNRSLPDPHHTSIGALKYSSDGQNYRIEGRTGYFVTNASPKHPWSEVHWGESVNPLEWLGFWYSDKLVAAVFALIGLCLIFLRRRFAGVLKKTSVASAAENVMLWSGIAVVVMAILCGLNMD